MRSNSGSPAPSPRDFTSQFPRRSSFSQPNTFGTFGHFCIARMTISSMVSKRSWAPPLQCCTNITTRRAHAPARVSEPRPLALTATALALILAAAAAPAGWNYSRKPAGGGAGFMTLVAMVASVLWAPFAAGQWILQGYVFEPVHLVPILASAAIHTAYFV